MTKLKVVGWQGFRSEGPKSKCTREICAVPSVAELCRRTGKRRSAFFNVCETFNEAEIAQAMTAPGVVFWRGIDERLTAWRRDG